MQHRKLLLLSRDPGATNQMVGVHWLAQNKVERRCFPLYSKILFGREDGDVEVLIAGDVLAARRWADNLCMTLTQNDDPECFLKEENITHLVTGLDDIDAVVSRKFWEAARKLGIPIIVITDNDINLKLRCVDSRGQPFWPDDILARNATALTELPHEIVTVEGDIYHAYLQRQGPSQLDLRAVWGVTREETVVLFVSQNCQEMKEAGRVTEYNEYEQLQKLLDWLKSGFFPPCKPIENPVLLIRLHPRDHRDKYKEYIATQGLKVIISQVGTPIDVIANVDFVAGMKSALMEEAELMGREVVSLLELEDAQNA